MMSDKDKNSSLRESLITEIFEEIACLEGNALDEFLIDIGEEPSTLLEQSTKALNDAVRRQKMVRFENARERILTRKIPSATIISGFELAKKQSLLKDIKKHIQESGEMTLAARNQKIESEEDLDSFLEACLRLGLIDEEGNLKD